MLEFPYQPERIRGNTPPSLASGERYQWRPLIPIKLLCPSGVVLRFDRALIDCGSHDTVLPLQAMSFGGIAPLAASGYRVRWSGLLHDLQFGRAELRLEGSAIYQWTAVVGFTSASIRYPLLGVAGFLQYFDLTLRGAARMIELTPNATYPGTIGQSS